MDNDGYRSAGGLPRPVPSRGMRAGIVSVELLLAGLIAVLLANFAFKILTVEPQQQPLSPVAQRAGATTDTSLLLRFDPFFRETIIPQSQAQSQLPESTLNIQVFGLRARADGSGSAIIKLQDGEQKLAQVGDAIAAGVELTAVYPDRLELRRAGVKEAVYLRPQQERLAVQQPTSEPIAQVASERSEGLIGSVLSNLALTPVRRDRRIIGFKLPDTLPLPLLGTGLEGGDIITSANGSPLSSFERLQEAGDRLPAGSLLSLEIERRGQVRQIIINLEETR